MVLPEHEMGRRIAHKVTGKINDYIELDADFALVETRVPSSLHGRTLAEANIRATYGVTVVFIKPLNESFAYAGPESTLSPGCMVLVAGDTAAVEAFAELT